MNTSFSARGAFLSSGRVILLAATLLGAAFVGGCAHPIALNPDIGQVVGSGSGAKIDKKAALLVSNEDRTREVVTPGGGGDKVSYFPYRDLETGLYAALSESFAQVTRVANTQDPKLAAENVSYVVTPVLRTTSHSPSLVTWPPTVFGIEISCKVSDPQGRQVAEVTAISEGRAEFDEFKSDFSLAARRAAEDVLKNLVKAFADNADKLR